MSVNQFNTSFHHIDFSDGSLRHLKAGYRTPPFIIQETSSTQRPLQHQGSLCFSQYVP